VNFSAAAHFSTEQNPVNWKGLKSRNFYSAGELLKMAIYRILFLAKLGQRILDYAR
jgi:hypothetical protein